jgi:hypothetical protein
MYLTAIQVQAQESQAGAAGAKTVAHLTDEPMEISWNGCWLLGVFLLPAPFGCSVRHLRTPNWDVGGGVNAEAHDAWFDGEHLNGGAESRQQDLFVELAG